jgi:DMSO/TMAO reductase YedYZ molybdopterin-dependent catalytic subunit
MNPPLAQKWAMLNRWHAMALLLLPLRLVLASDTNYAALVVRGEVEQPLALTIADLQALPRATIKAREKDGTDARFEGVALSELIKRAKPRLTEKCCSNAPNTCVIVRAADNYRVAFSLAEIDPGFTDRKVLLADRREGKPLSESEGPLRLVVPDEKVHARWVRKVRALEVIHVGTDATP